MLYYKKISSPLGEITLRSDGESLTGLWFADDKHYGDKDIQDAQNAELPVFALAEKWLAEYFAGCEPKVNVPLQFTGSDFQESVWKILQNIPYGRLVTYGDIAREIAAQRGLARMSAQAVGGAVGRNPLCIIIPCHRVIGADGSLTGYGGGMWRKVRLVEIEKADMSKFLALIIDSLNHDVTIGSVMNPTDKIHALLEKHKKGLI